MEGNWAIQPDEYARYIENFKSLDPQGSYVAGPAAREFFLQSSLPKAELARVWELADITRDGKLDLTEFCIAMQLIRKRVKGATIPDRLPGALQPARTGLESRNAWKNYSGMSNESGNGTLARPVGASAQPQLNLPSLVPADKASRTTSTTGLPQPSAPSGVPNSSITASTASAPTLASFALGGSAVPGRSNPAHSHPATTSSPNPQASFSSQFVLPSQTQLQQQSQPLSIMDEFRDITLDSSSNNINNTLLNMPTTVLHGGTTFPWAGAPHIKQSLSGPATALPSTNAKHSPFVTYIPPVSAEWEIPQPMRLRYNQAFHEALKASSFANARGRATAGLFMPGKQAKGFMLKSGVEQSILAHIWNLSDLDADGQLNSEEFCVAMHLLDEAQKGHRMPDMLPPLLVPPSYRRWWQDIGSRSTAAASAPVNASSLHPGIPTAFAGGAGGLLSSATGGADSGYAEGEFAALGGCGAGNNLTMVDNDEFSNQPKSFEDKRRENFSKGQAELDRRRHYLMEMERREKEERERRERAVEAERQRHREEVESRQMQIEMERRMQQQLELERQQDELRKRREQLVAESERQRYSELIKTRAQLLAVQRQRLQDDVQNVKHKLKNYELELENDELKRKTLDDELEQLKDSVRERKGIIDGMRVIRDQTVQNIEQAKHDKNEWLGKMNYLRSEKGVLSGRKGALDHQSALPESLRTVDNSCKVRREVVDELQDKMSALEKSTKQKLQDIDDHNAKMRRIQTEFEELFNDNAKLCQRYEEKRAKLHKRMNRSQPVATGSAVTKQAEKILNSLPTPTQLASQSVALVMAEAASVSAAAVSMHPNKVQYRALYAFQARNEDEITFQPGDTVIVSTDAGELEPGWIYGEVQITELAPFGGPANIFTKSGWLPENHVEPVPTESNQYVQKSFSRDSADSLVNNNANKPSESSFHDPFAGAVENGFGTNGHDAFGDAAGNAFSSASFDHDRHSNNDNLPATPKTEFASSNWAAFPPPSSSATAVAAAEFPADTNDAFAPSSSRHASSSSRNNVESAFHFGNASANSVPDNNAFSPPSVAVNNSDNATPKQKSFPPPPSLSSSTASHQHRPPSALSNNSSYTPSAVNSSTTAAGANVNTTTKIAMTLYPWTAKKDNHATFNKGEMVVIKKQVGGWCYGEPKQSQKPGWFPAAYVEIIKEMSDNSVDVQNNDTLQLAPPPAGKPASAASVNAVQTTARQTKGIDGAELYQVEFDFSSDVSGDLSFQIGETVHVTRNEGEWWTGYIGDDPTSATRFGIFPANFVAKLSATSPAAGTAVAQSKSNATPSAHHQPVSQRFSRTGSKSAAPSAASKASNSGGSTPTKSALPFQLPSTAAQDVYQALAPFKAAGPEQLTLEKGDLVAVRQKSSTGWWEGELVGKGGAAKPAATLGKAGWFPGNFVKSFASIRNA